MENFDSTFIFKRVQVVGDKNVGHLKIVATVMNKRPLAYWDAMIDNNKLAYISIMLPVNFWSKILLDCMNILTEQYYIIIEGGSAVFGKYLADFGQCLIDEDHPGPSALFLTNIRKNLLGMRVGTLEAKICFKPSYIFNFSLDDVYNQQLFFQTPELPNAGDRILKLVRSTAGANGIDIIMEKSYTIQAQGFLKLELPWSDNMDFKDRPNLIMMRSKFGRLGIKVQLCPLSRCIMLLNDSKDKIFLGNRFFQVVPSITQQFYFDFDTIIKKILGNSIGISYEMIIKERANKFEKLEDEDTFIVSGFGLF